VNFIAVTQIISGDGHKLKLGNILLSGRSLKFKNQKVKIKMTTQNANLSLLSLDERGLR
jgi:hypothetical protein